MNLRKDNQPKTNVVKHENGDLLADFNNILRRWKNYFCWLLNTHCDNNVRHTARPLVPEPSSFHFEIATGM